jgi:hypothetical protein
MAEKSLRDLIEKQIYEQKDTTDAVDALNKQFTQYFKVLERQKLPSEEKRRERGLMGRMLGGGSDNTAGKEDGGSLFGGLFAGVFKSLSGPLGFILRPLRLLARLLIRGGPIGIAIGLLYTVFRDIGDNPKFQESLEKMKETWQLVKSTFIDLKDWFVELSADPGIRSAVEMIKNWFIRLKDNIQEFVIDSLFGISDIITGTIGTITNLLNGDFSGAFESLKTALMGVVNILDSAVTNVLELFGADFGEDGSFLKSMGGVVDWLNIRMLGMWNTTTDWVKEKWNTLTQSVSDFFTDIVDFFTDANKPGSIPYVYNQTIATISQKVGDLGQALENFVVDSWNWITSWIPDPSKIAASIKQKVMDLVPDFIKDTVEFKTVTASKYRLTDDMRAEQALMEKPLVAVTATQPTIAAEQSRLRIQAENIARETDAFNRRTNNQNITIGQIGDNVQSSTTQAARAVAAAPLGSAVNTGLMQKRAMQGGNMFMMGSPLLHLLN